MTTMNSTAPPCWWCGAAADSREHRYKRTDLVNLFGPGAWQGSVSRVVDGNVRAPQSASSRELKFVASLCARCNNQRSQPLDRAYEAFVHFYGGHEDDVARTRKIDLRAVYGATWADGRENLARYLVKHICCRLAEANTPVPASFVAYLDAAAAWPDSLTAIVLFRTDLWELNRHTSLVHQGDARGVFVGPMEGMLDRRTGAVTELDSHYLYSSLGFHWRIDVGAGSGARNFDGPVVYLPEFAAVPPSEIAANCGECHPGKAVS